MCMPAGAPRVYSRRRPELDPLHRILSAHLLTFLAQAEHEGPGLPGFVQKELLGYLDCGLLCKGAIHLSCADCRHSIVVALSCKGRGVCPSCGGRRMNDTGLGAPGRQGDPAGRARAPMGAIAAASLPVRDRAGLELLCGVVRIFVGVVFGLLCRVAKAQGITDPRPGSIVAVQRFGDGLMHNTHLHSLFLQRGFITGRWRKSRRCLCDGPLGQAQRPGVGLGDAVSERHGGRLQVVQRHHVIDHIRCAAPPLRSPNRR